MPSSVSWPSADSFFSEPSSEVEISESLRSPGRRRPRPPRRRRRRSALSGESSFDSELSTESLEVVSFLAAGVAFFARAGFSTIGAAWKTGTGIAALFFVARFGFSSETSSLLAARVSFTSEVASERAADFLVARLRPPFGSGAIRSNPFHVPQLLVLRLGPNHKG